MKLRFSGLRKRSCRSWYYKIKTFKWPIGFAEIEFMELKLSNRGYGGGVVGVGIIKLKRSNGSWEGYGRVEALRFQKRVIKPL